MREHHTWQPRNAFWLPNGSVGQGRPEFALVASASSTNPHVAARATEATGRADSVRAEHQKTVTSANTEANKGGKLSVKALLGDDVPSGMLGSEYSRLAKMREPESRQESLGPSDRPHRPSTVGEYRGKDRLLQTARQSDLHATIQRPNTASGVPVSPMSPGRPGTPGSTALPFSPTRAFVRVGVPLEAAMAPTAQAELAASRAGGSFNSTSHSASAGLRPLTRPGHVTGLAHGPEFIDHVVDADTSLVSIGNATADLPTAAVKAVRRMVGEGRTLTVSAIHQRRPPYIDMGPYPQEPDNEMQVHNFGASLRGPSFQPHSSKRPAFRIGCPPPWVAAKVQAPMDTFDFSAKINGVKYYTQDFTQPTKAPLRPPTSQSTRYAANVPSMLYKPEAQPRHEVPNLTQERFELDTSIRMKHKDEGVPMKRPPTTGGRHLLPYANEPMRQVAATVYFP